jgi:Chloroplast import apparatus Tic20-like
MTGRSSIIAGIDRFWGCLPYLLPMIASSGSLAQLLILVPALAPLKFLLIILAPIAKFYAAIAGSIPLGSFVIFLLMYLAVVQNTSITYSIRFNTLQSILFSVILSLWGMVGGFVFDGLGSVGAVLMITLPLVVLGACLYCIGMTAVGKYADIPKFSDNVYMSLPN